MSIKKIRKISGLTQKEMANKLGLNYYTYRNKESGQKPFRVDEVWRISEILNISCDKVIMAILNLTEEDFKNANKIKRLSNKI